MKKKSTYKGITYRMNGNEENGIELVINGFKYDCDGSPFMLEYDFYTALKGVKSLIDNNYYANK